MKKNTEILASAPKYSNYCYTVYNTQGNAVYQVWYCQTINSKVNVAL